MKIVETLHDDPRTAALIALQKQHALEHTPQKSGHALDAGSREASEVRFFLALDGDEALGCLGLAAIGPAMGELKTMHVLKSTRGQGIGAQLLIHVIDVARQEGMEELVLETGSNEGFAASRRLYARAGFEVCDPWDAYVSDPFSHCMRKEL